jgi:hypothetical protein
MPSLGRAHLPYRLRVGNLAYGEALCGKRGIRTDVLRAITPLRWEG